MSHHASDRDRAERLKQDAHISHFGPGHNRWTDVSELTDAFVVGFKQDDLQVAIECDDPNVAQALKLLLNTTSVRVIIADGEPKRAQRCECDAGPGDTHRLGCPMKFKARYR
jgi:hypothetical protein